MIINLVSFDRHDVHEICSVGIMGTVESLPMVVVLAPPPSFSCFQALIQMPGFLYITDFVTFHAVPTFFVFSSVCLLCDSQM